MKNIIKIVLALTLGAIAYGQQNTLVRTTLASASNARSTSFNLASVTGVNAPSSGTPASMLYVIDKGERIGQLVQVQSILGTVVTFSPRGSGAQGNAHASGAVVLVATAPNWFVTANPTGPCTTSSSFIDVYVNTNTGDQSSCDADLGAWVAAGDSFFFVPPTQCTTAPTTSTVTNTYPQVGASTVFVLNATTNSAAGTTTLVCNIQVPSRISSTRGAYLKNIVVAVGSQTTAPTSIGTATLGTITMPTPVATTQTASTVTPVTAGALTQVGPTTTVLTVTTAGAFLTFKYTPAAPVVLSSPLQLLQFTVPYLQGAAAVMTLNWPGLWIQYVTANSL